MRRPPPRASLHRAPPSTARRPPPRAARRYFNLLWAIIRLFMKKKLRDRIHMVSKSSAKDMARLAARFSKEQLPVKFGGEMTPEQSKAAMAAWVAERLKAEA